MFSLNLANSVTNILVITVKELEPATQSSCVRDQDVTTVPTRHIGETRSEFA